jgi:hypothetical protein
MQNYEFFDEVLNKNKQVKVKEHTLGFSLHKFTKISDNKTHFQFIFGKIKI